MKIKNKKLALEENGISFNDPFKKIVSKIKNEQKIEDEKRGIIRLQAVSYMETDCTAIMSFEEGKLQALKLYPAKTDEKLDMGKKLSEAYMLLNKGRYRDTYKADNCWVDLVKATNNEGSYIEITQI